MSEDMKAVIFDTETTAKEPDQAKIVQFGALLDHGADEVPDILFNSLCDPGVEIPEGASNVHGILNEHLEYEPTDTVVVEHFMRYLGTQAFPVLVGHNIEYYDIEVVANVNPNIRAYPKIDTYLMARRAFPMLTNHQLSTVYVELGGTMDPEGAHDAVYDCILNHFVFHKLMEKFKFKTVKEFWEYSMWPVAYEIMPFGKYKGVPVEDVGSGYFQWMENNFKDIGIDLQATIDKRLGRSPSEGTKQ